MHDALDIARIRVFVTLIGGHAWHASLDQMDWQQGTFIDKYRDCAL